MTLVDLVPSFLPLRGSCPTEVLQGETQNLQLLHFLPLWGRHRGGVCVLYKKKILQDKPGELTAKLTPPRVPLKGDK